MLRIFPRAAVVALACALSGCAPATHAPTTVWQLAPFALLQRGGYDGTLTVGEVLRHGNIGVGAMDALNGEVIVVDGRMYQFLAGGGVVQPLLSARMPFAVMTWWEGGDDVPVAPGLTYPALRAAVDPLLPTLDAFYALRMEGTFDVVMARTFPEQTRPYPPLDAVKPDTFIIASVEGTMVGFREPSYVDSLSVPNYHLHFVSKDGRQGGHVLGFTTRSVRLRVSNRPQFTVWMPPAKPSAPAAP